MELDNELAFHLQPYASRFTPLGTDTDGRAYYVSTAIKGKKTPSASDRESMRKWSWFLAVWGKEPTNSPMTVTGEKAGEMLKDKMDVDDDDVEEGEAGDEDGSWWGFSDPVQIRKLAKWLAWKDDEMREALSDTGSSVEEASSRTGTGGLPTPPTTAGSSRSSHSNSTEKTLVDGRESRRI